MTPSPEFWLDAAWKAGEIALVAIGGYFTIKQGVREAKAGAVAAASSAEDAKAALEHFMERFEEHEVALRKRLEGQDSRITIVETVQKVRDEDTKAALRRIESSIAVMGANVSADIRSVHSRIDEAFKDQGQKS